MPSHPLDFQIQTNIFATPELLSVFDEKKRFQRWLDIEAALAQTQGELGIIPRDAASEIAAKASLEHIDLSYVHQEYQLSRNSLVPLLKGLRKACGKVHGEFVHYGATTQDILDTAQILELKETFAILYRDLRNLEHYLLEITECHQNTPMIARTHGQQALPITFGLKTAVWLSETRRHIERIKQLYPRILTGQLSGAVGTMAAFGPKALAVVEQTLTRLGLKHSPASWHTSRDTIAETAAFFSILSGTLEKIANEIFQLGKNEISELHEPLPSKAISSSTMPHKRNPVLCQRISVLARHARSLTSVVFDSMVHEHERDARALWSEWLAMPQIAIYTATALSFLTNIMGGLEVNLEKMKENLYLQKEMVISEWLLFHMSQKIGKMRAQEKIHTLLQLATAKNISLKEILAGDQEVGPLFGKDALEMFDHPERYIGNSIEIITAVLHEVTTKRQNDPEVLV